MKKVNKKVTPTEEEIKKQVAIDEALREEAVQELENNLNSVMSHLNRIKDIQEKQSRGPSLFSKVTALVFTIALKLAAFWVLMQIVIDTIIRLR